LETLPPLVRLTVICQGASALPSPQSEYERWSGAPLAVGMVSVMNWPAR
jgi:hypothetical protein